MAKSEMSASNRESSLRWVSVSTCGAVAALLLAVLGQEVVGPVSDWLRTQPPTKRVLTATLVVLLALTCGKPIGITVRGARNYLWYPPYWVGAVIGAELLLVLAYFFPSIAASLRISSVALSGLPMLMTVLACIPLALALADEVRWRRSVHEKRQNAPPPNEKTETLNAQNLFSWLSSDRPIIAEHQDLFGHRAVASRIVLRVKNFAEAESSPVTTVIVGKRGSGKSSIIKLVESSLWSERVCEDKLVFARISIWPAASTDAALRLIVSEAIEQISNYVDVLGIRGLPATYVEAVESAPSGAGALWRIARKDLSPRAAILQLNNVLLAARLRFVICIEDTERFADTNSSTPRGSTGRLSGVFALIDLFEDANQIGVISCVDSSFDFDFEKVARFVDRPPTLSGDKVANVLRTFLLGCRSLSQQCIDPASCEGIDHLGLEKAMPFAWVREITGKPSRADAISALLDTPRSLKVALLRALEKWKILMGEVDLHDVIVVSILETVQPSLIGYIDSNIEWFRHPHPLRVSDISQDKSKLRMEGYRQYVSNLGEFGPHLEVLVGCLFPIDPNKPIVVPPNRPQAVSGAADTDYWSRLLTGLPVPLEHRDQSVLCAILEWTEGADSGLISRLSDSFFGPKVKQFIGQLKEDDKVRLFAEMVEYFLAAPAKSRSELDSAVQHTSVALHRSPPRQRLLVNAICSAYEKSIPGNLYLAQKLEYWFAHSHESVSPLIAPEHTSQLRAEFCARLVAAFADKPEALRLALADHSPYLLYWCAYSLPVIRSGDFEKPPFPAWSKIARTMLRLAKSHPAVGLPAIVPFVTKSVGRVPVDFDGVQSAAAPEELIAHRTSFLPRLAEELFGLDEVKSVFSVNLHPDLVSDEIRDKYVDVCDALI